MTETSEPPIEGPFTIKVEGGEVVHENIHKREDAIGLMGDVARRHPGRRVVVLDHLDREIAEDTEDAPF